MKVIRQMPRHAQPELHGRRLRRQPFRIVGVDTQKQNGMLLIAACIIAAALASTTEHVLAESGLSNSAKMNYGIRPESCAQETAA
jgi:hypothetical protein